MTRLKREMDRRKAVLIEQGRWREPTEDVPEAMWLDALWREYADRFAPVPPKVITDQEYEKMRKEMYND